MGKKCDIYGLECLAGDRSSLRALCLPCPLVSGLGRVGASSEGKLTLSFLRQQISRLLPSIAPYVGGFSHDLCDATIAAYTAFLHSQDRTELCSEPEECAICLPVLDRVAYAG